jgi:hypothetical protein
MEPIDNETLFRLIPPSGVSVSGDQFIKNPRLPAGQVDKCTRDAMHSMTLEQRIHWHEYWRLIIRDCEQRRIVAKEAIWGRQASNDAT